MPVFFAAVIAAESSTSPTAARTGVRGATIVAEAISTMAAIHAYNFGGMRIDRAVGAEVIERLQPLGVEAAISAVEARQIENTEKRRQVDLALEQAHYEPLSARG